MKYNKIVFCLVLVFFSTKSFSLSLSNLMEFAIDSNSEIKSSLAGYDLSSTSARTLDGAYVPEILISSSTNVPYDYKWYAVPEYINSNITYSQPLPGGTSFSIGADYAYKTPGISVGLSQSLLPFWLQGKIKDPVKLSAEKQKEYNYNQYLYVKKNVIQNVAENYINLIIARNEIHMNQNNISLFEEQIDALKVLKESGNTTQAKILEIENSKWTAQQNLMSAQSKYICVVSQLKKICGQDFNENEITFDSEDNINLQNFLDLAIDPLEETFKLKIEILESSRLLEKQSYAPVLNLSVQPKWQPETFNKIDSWNASIGINLSPMISGIVKQNKRKYQINRKDAEESFSAYLQQKAFVHEQFKIISEHYTKQKQDITTLYKAACREKEDYSILYEEKSISKLDFDSVQVRVENCRLSKEIIEANCLLYEILLQLN